MRVKDAISKQYKEFRFLTDKEIRRIQEKSVFHSYKKGQVLFNFDDKITHVFLVIKGYIKLERVDETGTFTYLQFKGADCLIPILNLSANSEYYLSAIAHTDIEVIAIPIKLFENVLNNNHQQLIANLQEQVKEMRTQIIKIQKGMMNNSNYRITTTLALIYHDLGKVHYPYGTVVVDCPLTVNDIARASGTSRETASHVLKKLNTAKKINYRHKHITFIDTKYFDDILDT